MSSRLILSGIYATASLITIGLMIYSIDINRNVYSSFELGEFFLESLVKPTLNALILGISSIAFLRQKKHALHLSILAILFNTYHITYNVLFNVRYEYYNMTEIVLAAIGFYGIILVAGFLTWKFYQERRNEIKNVPQQRL